MNHQVTLAARISPAIPATPKAPRAASLTWRTVASLPGHQPDRAHPVLVGAAHAVRVVVDVVGADLNAQSDEQGKQRVEPVQLPHEGRADGGVTGAGELWRREQ